MVSGVFVGVDNLDPHRLAALDSRRCRAATAAFQRLGVLQDRIVRDSVGLIVSVLASSLPCVCLGMIVAWSWESLWESTKAKEIREIRKATRKIGGSSSYFLDLKIWNFLGSL